MLAPTGTPAITAVLVAPTAHASPVFGCARSEPPVATKLMLPTKRAKRVIGAACEYAAPGPNSSPAATTSNASVRLIAPLEVTVKRDTRCGALGEPRRAVQGQRANSRSTV